MPYSESKIECEAVAKGLGVKANGAQVDDIESLMDRVAKEQTALGG